MHAFLTSPCWHAPIRHALVLVLFIITLSLAAPPRLSGDQLHALNVGLVNTTGKLSAFGDFNNDRFTDLFFISSEGTSIYVTTWDTKLFEFGRMTTLEYTNESLVIQQIVPSDFNHDGNLDVLMVAVLKEDENQYFMQVHFGNTTHFASTLTLDPPQGQVTVFDYNLDLFPDILGNAKMEGDQLHRMVWLNVDEGTEFKLEYFSNNTNLPPIHNSASVGLVDLDGDCLSELIIPTETKYEVWTINDTSKFIPHPNISHFDGLQGQGQITFTDVDGDGNVDFVIPVCHSPDNCAAEQYIKIIYNQQKSVCTSLFSRNCRSASELCVKDTQFKIPSLRTMNESEMVILPKEAFGDDILHSNRNLLPLTLRTGDYNLDRYPDLLIPVRRGDKTKMQLWKNVPCTKSECGENTRRTFKRVTEGVKDLDAVEGVITGAFFSLDEGGKSDIVLVSYNDTTKQFKTSFLYNNFYNDAYFLKLLGLNGVCTMCLRNGGKPYSVNQHGTVFKIAYSDMSGNQLSSILLQLPQSSHWSLNTPYVFTGIGRPASYVDYVSMGVMVTTEEDHRHQTWPGIIPNSQVVVSPYPKESPSKWGLELYISPSKSTGWIALAVVCWLVVMGAAIIGLQYKEKRQDDKEMKEKEHLFSFKAM